MPVPFELLSRILTDAHIHLIQITRCTVQSQIEDRVVTQSGQVPVFIDAVFSRSRQVGDGLSQERNTIRTVLRSGLYPVVGRLCAAGESGDGIAEDATDTQEEHACTIALDTIHGVGQEMPHHKGRVRRDE